MKAANLRPELERARMLNKKLNDQLAATEQTVRIQAEKLNKCRAAMSKFTLIVANICYVNNPVFKDLEN